MRIIWAERTKADIRRVHNFLKKKNPTAATKAVQLIREKSSRLADFPESGTEIDDHTARRELYIRFGRYGYTIRYVYDQEAAEVLILRVWHGKETREDA